MSTLCETHNPDYDTVMTKEKLHNKHDRMEFITDIANNYHDLMLTKAVYMRESIEAFSSWSEHV